ncbi:translation initiation factor [Thalictrum thalictroides]|uniref:Translation initiation factor n=1 Tax=Thalictrum thalictroides TaxID=46969 RepID=A0A7J6V3F8_THATH|nr:translation initiation factor [Thalictrum thalictroides]
MEETKVKKKVMNEKKEVQPEAIDEETLTCAMRANFSVFREQADSLTLEGVRRALEKELKLKKFALDAQKKFIKQCLSECFDAATNENVSKSSGETGEEIVTSTKEETLDFSEKLQPHQELKGVDQEEELQGSPVLGLLAEVDGAPNDAEKTEGVLNVKALSEDIIKKAVIKKASYFRTNSEKITLAGARRLLEEDLKLDKHALDPYKKLVKEQLDKVLQSSGDTEPTSGVKNKKRKKVSCEGSSESLDNVDEEEVKPEKKVEVKSKRRKKVSYEGSSESLDSMDEEEVKPKKKVPPKLKIQKSETPKNEASTQIYGKHVEQLKAVIKSCGMSVPPSIYKRAKQAPETKREAFLIKELEEMLKKEGLSANPSEKEIKAVKKQKQRTKELEGIDLSNIVSSSRRRSTSSFFPPPKPKVSVSSDDGEDDEDGEGEDDNSDDDENDSDDGNETENAEDSNSE